MDYFKSIGDASHFFDEKPSLCESARWLLSFQTGIFSHYSEQTIKLRTNRDYSEVSPQVPSQIVGNRWHRCVLISHPLNSCSEVSPRRYTVRQKQPVALPDSIVGARK